MKKYKLIKEYPGSPKLGTEIINNENVNSAHTLDKTHYYNGYKIQEYPEFWKEVVEKDYEILSLSDLYETEHNNLAYLQKNGTYCHNNMLYGNGKGSDLKTILTLKHYIIYSVKRLSDGEVFTVGDKIKTSVSNTFCSIYGFDITNTGKLEISCTHSYLARCEMVELLNDIQHVKKPLFTTKDGVDIYEGDKCYFVNCTFSYWQISSQQYDKSLKNCYYFSTKKAAEKYIEENKPQYSLNDIEKAYFSSKYTNTCIVNIKKKLKELKNEK